VTNRPRLRLSPDYGVEYPLWLDGNRQPNEIGLTQELGERLAAWQSFFDEKYHHERGWRTRDDRAAFEAEGKRLREALQSEVGDRLAVVLNLWPVP
jgi:hypothetical protein